jgi:hypothetical protein
MHRSEFDRLMHAGIGSSYKRADESAAITKLGRPYIGRLGLGILALAQICSQFDIISHHRATKTAFRATIKFPAYTREEIDKIRRSEQDVVLGGLYQLHFTDFDDTKPGLRIFTVHLREAFRKRMRSLTNFGNRRGKRNVPYETLDAFLDAVYGRKEPLKSLNLMSDYDQLLFGLALAAPLPLIPDRNIATSLPAIEARQAALKGYEFEIRVDNLLMAQPVCLPSDQQRHTAAQCTVGKPELLAFTFEDGAKFTDCAVSRRPIVVQSSDERFNLYEFQYDSVVAGRRLAFAGYLFQQTGRLYPRDIQGVLIRINNVAIGKYDNSMLSYPYAEGPRYAMVSSELFVDAGFEDALNIDRDSFNELHAHYIRLQAYMHGFLHNIVFPETWTEEKGRNQARRVKARRTSDSNFMAAFEATTGERFQALTSVAKQRKKVPVSASAVHFAKKTRDIELDRSHPVLQAVLRRSRFAPLVERITIAFERANVEPTATKRRELFYRLLIEILKGA